MSSIGKLIQEYKSKKRYYRDLDEAIDVFQEQKDAIRGIRTTSGFAHIVEYLKREMEIQGERASTTTKREERDRAWDRRMMAKNWHDWLVNLAMDEEQVEEKADPKQLEE